jgi:hypothetical protein
VDLVLYFKVVNYRNAFKGFSAKKSMRNGSSQTSKSFLKYNSQLYNMKKIVFVLGLFFILILSIAQVSAEIDIDDETINGLLFLHNFISGNITNGGFLWAATPEDFKDAVSMVMILKETVTEFSSVSNFPDTSLEDIVIINDGVDTTIELSQFTRAQLFESIDFEARVTQTGEVISFDVTSFEVTDSSVEDLLNIMIGAFGFTREVSFYEANPSELSREATVTGVNQSSCGFFDITKQGTNLNIIADCGLEDIDSIDNFQDQVLGFFSWMTPSNINAAINDEGLSLEDFDFSLETNVDTLDFPLAEGDYDIEFYYTDGAEDVTTIILPLSVIYDSLPETPSTSTSGESTPDTRTITMDFSNPIFNSFSIRVGDIIEMSIGGQTHELEVLSITPDFAYIEIRSEPRFFILRSGESMLVDTDDDGVKDLEVRLAAIYYQPSQTSESKVQIELSEVSEPESEDSGIIDLEESQSTPGFFGAITGAVIGTLGTGGTFAIVVIVIALIGLIVVYIVSKKKR